MAVRFLILLGITIAFSIVQGLATDRWSPSPELQQSAEFVRALPGQLGEWTHVKDAKQLTPRVIEELGVTSHVSRVYSDGQDTVTLLFMSGETARLIRHTPDICYESTGNTFLADPTPATLEVDQSSHDFRVLPIRDQQSGEYVVTYGFASGGWFTSPSWPRLEFHGQRAVHKLQVLGEFNPDAPTAIPESSKRFLTALCRYLKQQHTGARGRE